MIYHYNLICYYVKKKHFFGKTFEKVTACLKVSLFLASLIKIRVIFLTKQIKSNFVLTVRNFLTNEITIISN